ncbi:MAG: hypothetical protein IIB71_13745 [Proteobacteria bacterium]|nr:hypothetical protein [Pseudomonadota bacterium]
MLNKLIIAFLAISLVAVPAATSAALKMTTDASVDGLSMGAMHADYPTDAATGALNSTAEVFVMTTAENEKCHQVEESGCCKDECGCCLSQFFPMSANIICAISFSQPKDFFESVGLLDSDLDRLIRPPRYI